jgi:hypothetical protein
MDGAGENALSYEGYRNMDSSMSCLKEGTSWASRLAKAMFYMSVFSTAFYLFHVQAFSVTYVAEFQNHLKLAKVIAADLFGFSIPHPGFHWMTLGLSRASGMSLEYSGIIVLSLFVVVIALMINAILASRMGKSCSEMRRYFVGGCLLVVSSIYFPPVSKNFYLGQGTANFWAVPTIVVVKPFALASVLLLVTLLSKNRIGRTSWVAFLLSLSLLASLVMKPNFVLGFLPVAGLYLLIKWRTVRPIRWPVLLSFAPSVLFMLFQYHANYSSSSGIVFTFFGVWKEYTGHIAGSILLGITFPLSWLIFQFRSLRENDYLLISWLFYGVTFLQFAFLAEDKYFTCGNFSWGYNIALWFLFIFTAADFFRWLKEEGCGIPFHKRKAVFMSLLFSLHLVSGVAYLVKQLAGGGYY